MNTRLPLLGLPPGFAGGSIGGAVFDVEVEAVTRGERREAAVAVVGYDRLELGQRRVLRVELRLEELSGRLDVVRLGRLDRDRER